MSMSPTAETDVVGRHGTVYSHDVIGPEANVPRELVEEAQREARLSIVRVEAKDDIEAYGLVAMADMRFTLENAVAAHESLGSFVGDLTLEEVTAEYLYAVANSIISAEQGEISADDCTEYFTGLLQLLPELARTT